MHSRTALYRLTRRHTHLHVLVYGEDVGDREVLLFSRQRHVHVSSPLEEALAALVGSAHELTVEFVDQLPLWLVQLCVCDVTKSS